MDFTLSFNHIRHKLSSSTAWNLRIYTSGSMMAVMKCFVGNNNGLRSDLGRSVISSKGGISKTLRLNLACLLVFLVDL